MIAVMCSPGLEAMVPKVIRARFDGTGRWVFPALLGPASVPMSTTPPGWYPKNPYAVGNCFSLGGYCPYCHERVRFEPIDQAGDTTLRGPDGNGVNCGQRRCPNDACAGMVFVIFTADTNRDIVRQYPVAVLDFDPEGLPAAVVESLTEAVKCHAHDCDIAAAIMLRRTIEFVCDHFVAEGSNLRSRIDSLDGLTDELRSALHDLRALGNDAVHVDPRDFEDISAADVGDALEVVVLVLDLMFRASSVLAKLSARKNHIEESPPDE